MLIDDFMPIFDFSETQEIAVAASRAAAFCAVKNFDMSESTSIRWLFKMRGIKFESLNLRDLETVNFKILGENPNHELLIGIAGKFASLSDKLLDVNPKDFANFKEPGFIKAVWNFAVLETNAARSRIVSEIRINATNESSLAKVEKYWGLIKPPSAMICQEILKLIKKQAEFKTEEK